MAVPMSFKRLVQRTQTLCPTPHSLRLRQCRFHYQSSTRKNVPLLLRRHTYSAFVQKPSETRAVSTTSQDDSKNFWNVASGTEDDYWDSYEATRPDYADSGFFNLMYDYHESKPHATSFNVAHDVGCGSGVGAAEMANRFVHVVASDNNGSSLYAAQRRLKTTLPDGKVSFILCTGEDLVKNHEPASADFISVAECIPLMDIPLALRGFATLLKPEGTLAIWFYGRPHFTEPEWARVCQPLFDQIADRTFAKVITDTPAWKQAAEGMASWLDYVDLSSTGQWEHVQRRTWNRRSTQMAFFTPAACPFPVESRSCVGAGEEVIEKEDPQFWGRSWDIEGVKRYINFSFPNVQEQVERDGEIQRLYGELADAMGGPTAERAYTWGAVLILATRSRS